MGKRKTIVIVAEGATDRDLNPISASYVKDVLAGRMGLDTRITTLGHVQRGGTACAYDRMLATLQGVEAVEAILASTPDKPSPVITVSENKIGSRPLMEAVEQVSKQTFPTCTRIYFVDVFVRHKLEPLLSRERTLWAPWLSVTPSSRSTIAATWRPLSSMI